MADLLSAAILVRTAQSRQPGFETGSTPTPRRRLSVVEIATVVGVIGSLCFGGVQVAISQNQNAATWRQLELNAQQWEKSQEETRARLKEAETSERTRIERDQRQAFLSRCYYLVEQYLSEGDVQRARGKTEIVDAVNMLVRNDPKFLTSAELTHDEATSILFGLVQAQAILKTHDGKFVKNYSVTMLRPSDITRMDNHDAVREETFAVLSNSTVSYTSATLEKELTSRLQKRGMRLSHAELLEHLDSMRHRGTILVHIPTGTVFLALLPPAHEFEAVEKRSKPTGGSSGAIGDRFGYPPSGK